MAEVEEAVLGMVATVQGRLAALADLSGNARDQQSRRDNLLDFIRLRDAWIQAVRQAWRQALASPGLAALRREDQRGKGLELVGDDEVENAILVSRLGLVITERVSWEFKDVRLRIMSLEHQRELAERDILKSEIFIAILVQ